VHELTNSIMTDTMVQTPKADRSNIKKILGKGIPAYFHFKCNDMSSLPVDSFVQQVINPAMHNAQSQFKSHRQQSYARPQPLASEENVNFIKRTTEDNRSSRKPFAELNSITPPSFCLKNCANKMVLYILMSYTN
jgi:hypothetical protein